MKRFGPILAGCMILNPLMAFGAVSDEAFEQLRAELAALSSKLDSLATENAQLRRSQSTTDAAVVDVQESVAATHEAIKAEKEPTWADRISMKGDFRYRYQHDEVDRSGSDNRNRDRIRARAEVSAKLPGNVKTGLGFATGSDDPVSSNQTLGSAGSSKDVKLDLAYFDWNAFENTSARGGKFKNTFEIVVKSQLQWDGDWRPEGFDATWDNETFFAQGLGTYLESDDRKDEEWSYVVQAGWRGFGSIIGRYLSHSPGSTWSAAPAIRTSNRRARNVSSMVPRQAIAVAAMQSMLMASIASTTRS